MPLCSSSRTPIISKACKILVPSGFTKICEVVKNSKNILREFVNKMRGAILFDDSA